MAAKFNPIPSATLGAFLASKGFAPTLVGQEAVYQRANHHDGELRVRVFTSCSTAGKAVRRRGSDAIRVVLVWEPEDGKPVGVLSAKRVNRAGTTEAILDRVYSRMREVYGHANRIATMPRCPCGAPRYADSGKCIRRGDCQKKAA